ncbi:MAG: hypothetical protein LIO46_03835 [Clostridiales bacterium]|nr:hypothetical protein [Clostridiales bacterium]
MEQTPFIGIGHNPEGPDLPLGLGLNLAQDPDAMDAFGKLNQKQKENVIHYVHNSTSGDDAAHRINETIQHLHQHDIAFFQ